MASHQPQPPTKPQTDIAPGFAGSKISMRDLVEKQNQLTKDKKSTPLTLGQIINIANNKSKEIRKCRYQSNVLLRTVIQRQLVLSLLDELSERRKNLATGPNFRPITRYIRGKSLLTRN